MGDTRKYTVTNIGLYELSTKRETTSYTVEKKRKLNVKKKLERNMAIS